MHQCTTGIIFLPETGCWWCCMQQRLSVGLEHQCADLLDCPYPHQTIAHMLLPLSPLGPYSTSLTMATAAKHNSDHKSGPIL